MSTAKAWDFLVFGDLFVDLVMAGFPRLPSLGEEALATSFMREVGGGAAITSCGLAMLGARTQVLGVVGATDLDWFKQRFRSRGVDTQALIAHPKEPTSITVAVSTSSDRVFYTYAGANASLPQLLTSPELRVHMAAACHVHIAHLMDPACLEELSKRLHTQGSTVSVDVGWQESWLDDPTSFSALKEVDWFLPNEREAERITGESQPTRMLEWFRNHGLGGVALKLGPEGSAVLAGNELLQQPAVRVQPIETTGAGDCFDAGFLFAWLRGMPLRQCLAWGNVCGALSTRCHGGLEGFPSRAEVEKVLNTRKGESNGV
ncbi:MAG: carbohydrate kinase family protein [Terriglobales bacterium]|jgi:sugar/nucleoside kinase (ribokinase family)